MAVKVLIRRTVPRDKARELLPLFRDMRVLALKQPGYISGETLRKVHGSEEFLIISTWQSSDDWERWVNTDERKETQEKIDSLLGGATQYEIFHYLS